MGRREEKEERGERKGKETINPLPSSLGASIIANSNSYIGDKRER